MGCTRAVGRDSRQEESRVGPEVLGRVGTSWTRPARRMPRMQMNLDIADNHRKKGGSALLIVRSLLVCVGQIKER